MNIEIFTYINIKTKDMDVYKVFCQIRNKGQREIELTKSDFLNKKEENKNSPRKNRSNN